MSIKGPLQAAFDLYLSTCPSDLGQETIERLHAAFYMGATAAMCCALSGLDAARPDIGGFRKNVRAMDADVAATLKGHEDARTARDGRAR